MPPDLAPAAQAPQAYCEIDFPGPAGEGRLRADFRAAETLLVATAPGEVPELLARVEAFAQDGCWAVGFVAYEAAGGFDAALATRPVPPGGLPYAAFAIYRSTAPARRQRGEFLPGTWRDETPRVRFDAGVAGIRRGIAAGDYYQVNLTTRLRAPLLGDPLAFFDGLRASQPEAWCAYLDFGRWHVCSVSPELFFQWGADGDGRSLTSRPMKGTAARDADPVRDEKSALALRRSSKECAENLMIVDLIRNDLSRVARLGTVTVPRLLEVEAWPTVWQMTSTVSCTTRADTTLSDVFGALFPCGSVTGAPKHAAMARIATMETSPRGAYCGAVGVVKPGGEALFSVGIRTAVVDTEKGVAECGIGSGITLDSDVDGEWAEWQMKQLFLRHACPDYELLETLRLHRGRWWLRRGHLRRLARSAAALGFEFNGARIEAALAAAAARHPAGQWRARLRLSPGGAAQVEVLPLEALPAGAGVPIVALASSPVASDNPWLRHKTTRRGLYDALACEREGIFDTLLCNERNELTEFTRGNLVLDLGDGPVTPPLACGLLPGVLREALLARGRVRERVVTPDDLARAHHLWFVNSVRGAVAVRLVAGATVE